MQGLFTSNCLNIIWLNNLSMLITQGFPSSAHPIESLQFTSARCAVRNRCRGDRLMRGASAIVSRRPLVLLQDAHGHSDANQQHLGDAGESLARTSWQSRQTTGAKMATCILLYLQCQIFWSHYLFFFLLDLQRQIIENGGSRRLRQLQCFEQVKRALRMHPKPTTSQPQRAAATVSLCSKQTLISLVLQYSVDCRAPSTALLYGPKEGGNIQQEMSNTCQHLIPSGYSVPVISLNAHPPLMSHDELNSSVSCVFRVQRWSSILRAISASRELRSGEVIISG